MKKTGTEFVKSVLQHVMILRNTPEFKKVSEKLKIFKRVLIQDSTVIQLHNKLIKDFPGSANQRGKTSNMKIQAVIDILSNTFSYFDLTPFTKNDQKASHDVFDYVQKGDLILRDLGYFASDSFQLIISAEAFFISRLKFGVNLYSPDSKKEISLKEIIKKKSFIDTEVLVGEKNKLRLRLVGIKLPNDIADQRRRKCINNRDKRKNPSKEYIQSLGWNLYITNVEQDVLQISDIAACYGLRWRIEIIFKSWKSSFDLKLSKRTLSAEQLKTLIYSKLIVIVLVTTFYFSELQNRQQIVGKTESSSLLKLFQFIKNHMFIPFLDLIKKIPRKNIELTCKRLCPYEKRKRTNYIEKIKAFLYSY